MPGVRRYKIALLGVRGNSAHNIDVADEEHDEIVDSLIQ